MCHFGHSDGIVTDIQNKVNSVSEEKTRSGLTDGAARAEAKLALTMPSRNRGKRQLTDGTARAEI